MPDEGKVVKISISVNERLLEAVDTHERNRSAYFQRVARADLTASGRLVDSDSRPVAAKAAALAELIGDDAALMFIGAKYEEALAAKAANIA